MSISDRIAEFVTDSIEEVINHTRKVTKESKFHRDLNSHFAIAFKEAISVQGFIDDYVDFEGSMEDMKEEIVGSLYLKAQEILTLLLAGTSANLLEKAKSTLKEMKDDPTVTGVDDDGEIQEYDAENEDSYVDEDELEINDEIPKDLFESAVKFTDDLGKVVAHVRLEEASKDPKIFEEFVSKCLVKKTVEVDGKEMPDSDYQLFFAGDDQNVMYSFYEWFDEKFPGIKRPINIKIRNELDKVIGKRDGDHWNGWCLVDEE